MKIIVDAFGGDNAPQEILLGCVKAQTELGIDIALAGDPARIQAAARELGIADAVGKMEIFPATDVISQEDEPDSIVKRPESSLAVGLQALADGKGDAFASAGNSGALVVGATAIVKRIKGVHRVGFAPILPKQPGCFMLCDAGANTVCRPSMLLQFGIMGSEYMKRVMGVANPRVGLANVGVEPHKGDDLRREAYRKLSECDSIRFIGNVEARDIPYDAADVIVSDGLTGNMLVKMYEGVAMAVLGLVKGVFKKSLKNKLAAALVLGDMKGLKKQMDYNEYGGAPIMGCSRPVFKIHGSAKATTVFNGLRLTKEYVDSGFTQAISEIIKK